MKRWNEHEFSPHEQGTPYVVDEPEVLDSMHPLRQHINGALGRNPGRWVLVYAGGSSSLGREKLEGVVTRVTRADLEEHDQGVVYHRTYIRIYAHDGSNADPLELAKQASSLPKPSFDMPLDMWIQRIKLPKIDMTDNGFNWTQEELDDATRLAMSALRQHVTLTNMMRRIETARKRLTKCS